eukprot:1265269-Alexandrium_andersonii.AAC.1
MVAKSRPQTGGCAATHPRRRTQAGPDCGIAALSTRLSREAEGCKSSPQTPSARERAAPNSGK